MINEIILFEEKTVHRDTALNDILKGGDNLYPPFIVQAHLAEKPRQRSCSNE